MTRRNLRQWIPTVCVPAIALIGSLAFLPGCPVKTGCVNCHISGVMADPAQPNTSPASAVVIQLEGTGGRKVSSVAVTIYTATGDSETHRYDGADVSGINDTSPTSISDADLYDINGQPPVKGTIEITLNGGSSFEDSLGVEAERPPR